MFKAELAYTQFLGLSTFLNFTITTANLSYRIHLYTYKQTIIWVGRKTLKSKFLFHSYRTRICKFLHHEINQRWGLKLEIAPAWEMRRIHHEYAWNAFADQLSNYSQDVLSARKPDTLHNIKIEHATKDDWRLQKYKTMVVYSAEEKLFSSPSSLVFP